jgi:hypothetical protein
LGTVNTARRMADTAAHLADRVLPRAPYRQQLGQIPRRLQLNATTISSWQV